MISISLLVASARRRFVVDCFGAKSKGLRPAAWFLTHFHYDHYGGLTKAFNQGIIYCSQVTARLVKTILKVPEERLVALPLNMPTVVAGARLVRLAIFLLMLACSSSKQIA